MATRTVQLQLAGLDIERFGSTDGSADTHLVSFTLSYPSAGVSSLTTVKKFSKDNDIDLAEASYSQKTLFKQALQGESELIIDVMAVDKPEPVEKFLLGLFKEVGEVAFASVTSGISDVVAQATADFAGDSLFDAIELEKSVQRIGHAAIPVASNDWTSSGEFSTDLVVPKTITTVTVPRTRSEPAETEILFKAGEVNGGCTIRHTVV